MPINFVLANSGLINCGSASIVNDIDKPNGMTISCWEYHRTGGSGNFGYLVAKVNTEAVNEGFWTVEMSGSSTEIDFTKNYVLADKARKSSTVFTTNTWNHVLITTDSSTTAANVHIYRNGVETAYNFTQDGSGLENTDVALGLGIGNSATNAGGGTFDGFLSEVAVWNVQLTQNEIIQLATAKVKGLPLQIRPASLAAYYPLDDFAELVAGTGTFSIQDRSGNGNHGTPNFGTNGGLNKGSAEQVSSYQ